MIEGYEARLVILDEIAGMVDQAKRYGRYNRRIQRPRCPRSARWRAGTRHADHKSRASDLAALLHPRLAGVSIYDGGTNHQVPSGPRAAASRAHKVALRERLMRLIQGER